MGEAVPGSNDFLHGGDIEAWKKTAYALKARYLNHLSRIAANADLSVNQVIRYGTPYSEIESLAQEQGVDLIVIGQVLRVPGDVQPYSPEVACVPWQVLTPIKQEGGMFP